MKKALSYAMIAILLGTATMLAPLMLFKLNYYGLLGYSDGGNVSKGKASYCPEAEETLDRQGVLERAVGLPNLSSVGLMLIPSFLLALGVSLYLKKRMF